MPKKGWKPSPETIAERRETRMTRQTITGRHVIAVDSLVFEELKTRGEALKDTPNSVLRRLLGLDAERGFGGYVTTFQLLQLYFSESSRVQRKHIMDTLHERFKTLGWLLK